MKVTHTAPWLIAELSQPMRVLSWSLTHPGFCSGRRIAFREVRNADLPVDLDVHAWLARETEAAQMTDTPVLLTSRQLSAYEVRAAQVEDVTATAMATVGLTNAERIGHRQPVPSGKYGTINIAVEISAALTEAAQIEALTIATQARTAAVMDVAHRLPEGIATGTGTDCIALAAPVGHTAYAGLHTAVGEALGRAVYEAVLAGARAWTAPTGA